MEDTPRITPSILIGNEPTSLNPMQQLLEPHVDTIMLAWAVVWASIIVFLAFTYIIKPAIKYFSQSYE